MGEKTALALLQGIGSIKTIYENLDKVAELSFRGAKTFAPKLLAEKEMADLSYLLATIKTDVELDVTHDQLMTSPQDHDKLVELFGKYEFKKWLNEVINGTNPVTTSTKERIPNNYAATQAVEKTESFVKVEIDRSKYETVTTEAQLAKWIKKIQAEKLVAVDTETNALDVMSAELVGISFGLASGEACYIPLTHKEEVSEQAGQGDLFAENTANVSYELVKNQLNLTACLVALKPILEDEQIKKIGQI